MTRDSSIGFLTQRGTFLAWGEWHTVGRVDIRPGYRAPWAIRLHSRPNYTHLVTKATPSGRDAVETALWADVEPTSYARFCFGADLEDGE